jgi:hypothetical protein
MGRHAMFFKAPDIIQPYFPPAKKVLEVHHRKAPAEIAQDSMFMEDFFQVRTVKKQLSTMPPALKYCDLLSS